jgi:tetratricopeptide (TPR) repeat protein
LGHSLLQRLGAGQERAAAWLLHGRAATRLRQGAYRAAEDDYLKGLALKQKVLPPDHPDIGLSWEGIANARIELGDFKGALEAIDKSLLNLRHAYGADSPLLAHQLSNRGEILAALQRHAEAEHDLRDAVNRWTVQIGPEHLWVAYALTALGNTLTAQGRTKEALDVLERALRIRQATEPNPELVAETRFALARALWEASPDRPRAVMLAVAARDTYSGRPTHARQAAEVDDWLTRHRDSSGVPRKPGLGRVGAATIPIRPAQSLSR